MTAADKKPVPQIDPVLGVAPSPVVVAAGKPIPKGGGAYQTGKGYKIGGRTFTPTPVEPKGYTATGLASYYSTDFHGRRTANGEVFDKLALSAAHPTLPLPCYVRVTNLSNDRAIIVRVNDRGPFHRGRLIDVSQRTAEVLGFSRAGVGRVKVDYVGLASLTGSDDGKLMATLTEKGAPLKSGGMTQIAGLFAPPPAPAPPPARAFVPAPLPARGSMPVPASPQPAVVASTAPAVYQPAPTAGAAARVATAQAAIAPMPQLRPAPAAPAWRQAAPAYAPQPAPAIAEPVAYAEQQPVAAAATEPSPAPQGGNARARVMLSWGGMTTTPMPLAQVPAGALPQTATALTTY